MFPRQRPKSLGVSRCIRHYGPQATHLPSTVVGEFKSQREIWGWKMDAAYCTFQKMIELAKRGWLVGIEHGFVPGGEQTYRWYLVGCPTEETAKKARLAHRYWTGCRTAGNPGWKGARTRRNSRPPFAAPSGSPIVNVRARCRSSTPKRPIMLYQQAKSIKGDGGHFVGSRFTRHESARNSRTTFPSRGAAVRAVVRLFSNRRSTHVSGFAGQDTWI